MSSDRDLLPIGEFKAIPSRRLTEETCAKWGYSVGTTMDKTVQIANYRDEAGHIVFQKIRPRNKDDMFSAGDIKAAGLYGKHLWRDKGKMVVVTEGEIDALSVSQAQGNKWPVVSVPNGAKGAKKALSRELQWLLRFDTIVLMFDMDDEGKAAAQECAPLFPPGRCKIAKLALKDPNELLVEGRGAEIIDAIWGAKTWRPDGIVTIADVKHTILTPPEQGLPWFLPKLTELTYGRRYGETYALGAGTGIGKTDWFTEQIMFDTTELNQRVGLFLLEQRPAQTVKRIAGKHSGKRFHVPDGSWTQDELVAAVEGLEKANNMLLYDSFGSNDWDVVESTLRWMSHSEGIRLFYLDHLTALADPSNEREELETVMEKMATTAQELDVIIHFISHLSRPQGRKPHEEGGRVMIRDFKGSSSIGFWSHFMFGLERDQHHEKEELRTVTTFRVLKDRNTGDASGKVIYLGYDRLKGRLVELDHDPFAAAESDPQVDFKDESEGAF
jgi:twinkle protein